MYQEKLREYFDKHMSEILDDLAEIISIESVADEQSEIKPFGEGSKKALEWGIKKLDELGMSTKNIDGYAVHGDHIPGMEPELGILSHLDVVPAGEGWHSDPFKLDIRDDALYGRGTIDDKGPSVAVLWAVKAIRELGIPISRNFRVIFGGDEEKGCKDMEYYEKKVGFPEKLFTPDGSFPVLNCEKGMVHLKFESELAESSKRVISLECGTVINAVPGKAVLKISGDNEELINALKRTDNRLDICEEDGSIVVRGNSSHGSRPERGINTATAVIKALNDCGYPGFEGLCRVFPHGEYNGKSAGLGFSDKISGEMTMALTILNINDGKLSGGLDIRFPIDRKTSEILDIITHSIKEAGMRPGKCFSMESHYVDEDSEFIQTLLKVYEDVTGEKGYCISEGGITYVHHTKGGVAFGAEFPDEDNHMHGPDEHITMETFKKNLMLYACAIIELTK